MNTNRWTRLFAWQLMNKNANKEESKGEESTKKKEETPKIK